MNVDILLLSRDRSPPREDVRRGIEIQRGVEVRVHRVVGTPRLGDANRWETIARARNEGKRLGSSPWVMYLDDDVVLGPECVARLVAGLSSRTGFAAMGADSAGEMDRGWWNWDYPPHVGMSATLFRRDRLAGLTFRWESEACECRCCCADLRRAGFGIGYLAGARAWHRPHAVPSACALPARIGDDRSPEPHSRPMPNAAVGRILTAFDRRHYDRFRRQFVSTLRASGNREPLTAIAYGLYPSECARLEAAGIEVIAIPENGVHPSIRRLHDFAKVVSRWPADTPVAHWDAGDVYFQGRIAPLWELVHDHPDRLLLAREPVNIGESPLIALWTRTILDSAARRQAFELLSTTRYLNAGFVAGTARTFLRHLPEIHRLRNSVALEGTLDWSDQTAMNLYCHTNPNTWHELPDVWNFCIAARDPSTYRIRPDRHCERPGDDPIHVVHGTGSTLANWTLAFLD